MVLVARLRALIRRGAPDRPVVLRAGDLTLDPARHRVERAGTELVLTPREFGLLEFLLRHRGDVVSKTEILEGVWDANYDGDPNVVEVYVGYLRRKIDEPFGRKSIETLRGVGYRLADEG
jgi:two-component system OmpR family response regulator